MATIFSEATLAIKFKKTTKEGKIIGGSSYIKADFKGGFGKFMTSLFSIFIILALGFMGNMVNQIL